MISTIKKLPWYKTELITIRSRDAIYQACVDLIRLLQISLRDRRPDEAFTPQLLKRLVTAAMLCPGFTVAMKDGIGYQAQLNDAQMREFNQPRQAWGWTHQYTICPKPGMPLDLLEVSNRPPA